MSESIETLGPEQEKRLRDLEVQIEDGLTAFVRLGEALTEIRDDQLYLVDHASFQDYCESRWEMSRGHAYRLMEAAEVVAKLREVSPKGDTPRHETHARALAPLKERPQEMAAAWAEAMKAGDGQPQAADVEEAVEARLGPPQAASAPPSPPAEELPPSDPTPIQSAVRDTLPDNTGIMHLGCGQLERLLSFAEADDHGLVRIEPTGRDTHELECGWRVSGERKRIALNRHGNSPPLGGQSNAA